VRVIELGRDLDLADEALRSDRRRELRPEHLERHLAIVP
jgi:hypothetical protein